MDWIYQFFVSIASFAVLVFVLYWGIRWRGVSWGKILNDEEMTRLENLIKQQAQQIADQAKQIQQQAAKIQELEESHRQERDRYLRQLFAEQQKTEKLEKRLSDLELESGFRTGITVLGVWPSGLPALDQAGSRDAIYNAGFEHVALFGPQANRETILHYLRRPEVRILELGGHGSKEGVMLADGLARPGWWESILRDRPNIRIVLLLSCYSDNSMYDGIVRAGVPHIITVNGEIEDRAAVDFGRAFYANYANGMEVAKAFREAKLILEYTQAAKLRLPTTVNRGD